MCSGLAAGPAQGWVPVEETPRVTLDESGEGSPLLLVGPGAGGCVVVPPGGKVDPARRGGGPCVQP